MNKINLYPYIGLTNEELIDFTIEEMDKLKILSNLGELDQYERRIIKFNQLIMEVKRRKLSIQKPLLAKRIFME